MRKLISTLVITTIAGCVSTPARQEGAEVREPASINPKQDLNFAKFENLLIQNSVTSVEKVLPILSRDFPDYLTFHTLMYHSLSIQEGTFEEPRAIVFGPNARFIFTFNGNANKRGGLSIETMEYSLKTHSFAFREITFKQKGFRKDDLLLAPNEVAYQDKRMIVSTANPGKCQRCHGQEGQPIWAGYFIWPGAYGSDDDQLHMSFDKSMRNQNNFAFFIKHPEPSSQGRRISLKDGVPDAELEGFAHYAAAKPDHPRYRYLPAAPIESAVLKYFNGTPIAQIDTSLADAAENRRLGAVGPYWPSRPNVVFTSLVQDLVDEKLLAAVTRAGLKDAYKKIRWEQLGDTAFNDRKLSLEQMSERIYDLLSVYPFKRRRPTPAEVEAALRLNLSQEYNLQQEVLYNQDANLGGKVLRYEPHVFVQDEVKGTLGEPTPLISDRRGAKWIGKTAPFYQALSGGRTLNELDLIAAQLPTDNLAINTAMALLLLDEGIDLHRFVISAHQWGLALNEGTWYSAKDYLGVPNYND